MLNAVQIVYVLKLVLEIAEALQCHGRSSSQLENAIDSLTDFCVDVPFTGEPPDGFYPEELSGSDGNPGGNAVVEP